MALSPHQHADALRKALGPTYEPVIDLYEKVVKVVGPTSAATLTLALVAAHGLRVTTVANPDGEPSSPSED